MWDGVPIRPRMLIVLISATALGAGCITPVSKGYEIHTADLSCDEANRQVYAALRDMDMEITSFTPAKPGQAGHVSAVRKSETNPLAGDVDIRCEGGRVDIQADQRGDLLGDKQFERGVFLGVTGRADLEVVRDGRLATGEVRRRVVEIVPTQESTTAAPSPAPSTPRVAPPPATGASLDVQMEAVRGFASVLDFDADLGGAGVLPVRVSIRNGTRRAYDLDPTAIVLNVSGQRTRVAPLTPADAYARLAAEAGANPSIGDVNAARGLLAEKALAGGRLSPGASREGFVYFPLGDYDRARLSLIDAATGESESFVVDF
jgi:hypothetical protein